MHVCALFLRFIFSRRLMTNGVALVVGLLCLIRKICYWVGRENLL